MSICRKNKEFNKHLFSSLTNNMVGWKRDSNTLTNSFHPSIIVKYDGTVQYDGVPIIMTRGQEKRIAKIFRCHLVTEIMAKQKVSNRTKRSDRHDE